MKSKPRRLPVLLLGIVLLLASMIPACSQPQEIPPQNWTVADETEFLAKCEHYNITFEKYESGDYVSYHLYRKIDGAKVELDQIAYIFNKETGELFDKYVHWRDDLPDELPPIISAEEAMAIGGGTKAYLLYIDPESSVSLVEPTPMNPCWEVSIYEEYHDPETNETFTYNSDIIVVDAVTGEILGHGVPLPTDTSVPDSEIASSMNQTDSPLSANATITIIMTTPPLPDE